MDGGWAGGRGVGVGPDEDARIAPVLLASTTPSSLSLLHTWSYTGAISLNRTRRDAAADWVCSPGAPAGPLPGGGGGADGGGAAAQVPPPRLVLCTGEGADAVLTERGRWRRGCCRGTRAPPDAAGAAAHRGEVEAGADERMVGV